MLVTTAIYGAYDELLPHPDHPAIERWVCYTDSPTTTAHNWDLVIEPPRFAHPRLSAKWRKCHPPTADCSMWIDASFEFHNADLIDEALHKLTHADLVLFSHPSRSSIVKEADVSASLAKYQGLPVQEQARHYIDRWGFPDDRLFAAGVFARRHTHEVLQAGAAWFSECEQWTYQDQISLPPILDRYGIEPAVFPYTLWDNPWFRVRPHRSGL